LGTLSQNKTRNYPILLDSYSIFSKFWTRTRHSQNFGLGPATTILKFWTHTRYSETSRPSSDIPWSLDIDPIFPKSATRHFLVNDWVNYMWNFCREKFVLVFSEGEIGSLELIEWPSKCNGMSTSPEVLVELVWEPRFKLKKERFTNSLQDI
jgi:hypothetical protein